MRKKILTLLFVPLLAALTLQAAAASQRHPVRTKAPLAASERVRNSNAFYAEPGEYPAPSYWSGVADGAMGSGLAGH